jgi:cation diffusion facilitator family transporter
MAFLSIRFMHTQDLSIWQHAHIFHSDNRQAEKKTTRVVWLTVTMMVIEVVAGWLSNSMALLADGWHMGTHAGALGISALAYFLSRRFAADTRFAFGTWKIEMLGGFTSAVLLGIVGLTMIFVSVQRLLQPLTIHYEQAILVALVGFGVNLVSIFILQEEHHPHEPADHHHHGHAHGHADLNLRAAYLHVIADAMTSVLAIVALLGGKFMQWNWLDPMMGIVGAGLILRWTYDLLKETGSILLDREMDTAMAADIRQALEDADVRVSDIHLWRVGQNKYACIVALVAKQPQSVAFYKARLQTHPELAHLTVEINQCVAHEP